MLGWMYADIPAGGEPEEIRVYIANLRTLTPRTEEMASDIAYAEALLGHREREALLERQAAEAEAAS